MKSGKSIKNNFNNLCNKLFKYLEVDYNCKKVKEGDNQVIYKNNTTAVNICYDLRAGGIYVYVVQLDKGNIPSYPKSSRVKSAKMWHDLGFIIDVVHPELNQNKPKFEELIKGRGGLENHLIYYADALKSCASDVLKGNFSIFPKVYKYELAYFKKLRRRQ